MSGQSGVEKRVRALKDLAFFSDWLCHENEINISNWIKFS